MILFSDLHLKPESADTCFSVLDAVCSLSVATGDPVVGFLGDFWHVRYAVPVDLLNRVHREFVRWKQEGITLHLLPGNHDMIDVAGEHAMEVFEGLATVYTHPTENGHGLWLPYRKDIVPLLAAVKSSTARYAFCHHGLIGAEMNSGIRAGAADGVPPDAFQKFEQAFFGHWHRHQTIGKCTYVGSPWQTTMGEAGQTKGVVQLDPETGVWQFTPLVLGKKFWKGMDKGVRAGDVVSLSADADKKMIAQLQLLGAEVRVAPPQIQSTVRWGTTLTFSEYARKYVEQAGSDLDKEELLRIFDEVVSS